MTEYKGRRSAEMSNRVEPGTIIVQAHRDKPDTRTVVDADYNPFIDDPMQIAIDGIPIIVYLDKNDITHIERDWRHYEADQENPWGTEGRLHQEIQDPVE